MFGRVLKIGCFVVVSTIFLTGCLLSSSIEQHVANNYEQLSDDVKAQTAPENSEVTLELAKVAGAIEQERQASDRYKMLLIGVVITVLFGSTVIGSTITLYLLNRHWQPIEQSYQEATLKGRMIRKPGDVPFPNIKASAVNYDQFDTQRTQRVLYDRLDTQPIQRVSYDRPPVRHYRVDTL